MKSVTIVSDDRVGLLADISYILGKSAINIDGLSVDVVGGKAVISLEVKDPKRAAGVLQCNGFRTTDLDSIIIKIANNAVEEITDMLEGEKVQVKEFNPLSSDAEDSIYAISVDKPRKATKMLSAFILGNSEAPSYY
ncbi:MAG: ACT domain-containing protein [Candidatus ainarchaeum sp.]|jgi:hypothetical protein|nr:ACT domain-containing protein [Candidatus ainarchaeum sp.]